MNRQSVNKLREMLNGQQKLGTQYVTQMYTILLHSLPLNIRFMEDVTGTRFPY